MSDSWKVIGRGKNGWHAKSKDCSSSGGSFESYLAEAEEGCLVYDADQADIEAFITLVYRGPMIDVSLEPGTVKKFGETQQRALLGMLPGLGGSFKGIGVATMCGLASLDTVAVDVYAQMLRENVGGIRIGKVERGTVVWEKGTTI